MPLAYADDVDIIGRSIWEFEAAFSKFAEEARCIGLAVNENKTKLLSSTAKDTSIGVSVEIDGYNFGVVKNFIYLGSSINTDNDTMSEFGIAAKLIRLCEMTLKNAQCVVSEAFDAKRGFRTKICLYKSLILPVLLYGAETWTLTSSDEQALGVFEWKILRKIYGNFCDRGEWRIR